jgi:hypothetical protein
MKKFAIVLSAALPILVFGHAQAQKLEPGKWTGTVSLPVSRQPMSPMM